jgi:hypothetical protein
MPASADVIQFPPRRDEAGQVWEPWVDEHVVARHFSVSPRTVRRWRVEGMPSKLIGGSRRYRIGDAERWHQQKESA